MLPNMLERRFVEGGLLIAHRPAEVHDPLVGRAAGHVPSVHPRLQYVGIVAPVRICGKP